MNYDKSKHESWLYCLWLLNKCMYTNSVLQYKVCFIVSIEKRYHHVDLLESLLENFTVLTSSTAESRQEADWNRERGAGSGKHHKPVLEFRSPEVHLRYISECCPVNYRLREVSQGFTSFRLQKVCSFI